MLCSSAPVSGSGNRFSHSAKCW